ncbi:Holliday junction branch migration DNA helicase RuvB [bacterium]|nr:Holliday junction branch migration DNA helicase RuvB [Candidatus Atribacteria bacterium]MBU1291191.1 Holliday junction branch migration DNA helicase RuvB [bacterium]MBU1427710.1 Holliday junction branch migration DNA helicase RuvB [bacterium]MBU2440611.1 Holliday junction branch migration DNA helicase RuvB [bacterium]MBU4561980.1 Holliday junction branch migration DNA helicase RuvB [bacterium]
MEFKEKAIDLGLRKEEPDLDINLRPKFFKEFIGQENIRKNFKIYISAALGRKEPIDHILLYGPPGLGKTTLAYIISNEMGVNIKMTSGPVIERAGDLAAIITNLQENDVLFIDEIHRLNRAVEEILYPAMEDFELDILIGKGPSARSIRISLPKFTLIGATTRTGLITSPLRSRFGVITRVGYYQESELEQVVIRSSKILKVQISKEAVEKIAERSRGTPRIANRLLRRLRDYAQIKGEGVITEEIADFGLKMMEIDNLGLCDIDKKLLLVIIEKFSGGPVGLQTLAASISEDADTICDVYEPYLLQKGFLHRTPKGRVATEITYKYFGKKKDVQGKLLQKNSG